ncbi:MAG: amidohydrolase family protein [Caldilineaceae bacterium]|nr:amidohydrolase family protein [Caldilineaceae bacterium]
MAYLLIQNGTVIDGNGGAPLRDGAVLIQDNMIRAVGRRAEIQPPGDAVTVIDAAGGMIMPGLIDTHVHLMIEGVNIPNLLTTPFSMKFYKAIAHMRRTIDAGITTVRDAGGADLGVKMAQLEGLIVGPRVQISVTALSITGGHGDGWMPSGMSLDLFPPYPGMPANTCDGVEEIRRKVREVLRAGAEVIKVCSTGGVLSPTDHPEFTQFTEEELRVMVQEGAHRRGVKVMAHAQGVEGIKNAIRAGIHSIEHGIYLDDEAIDLMLSHGTYLVPTLLAPLAVLEQAEQNGNMPEYGVRKARETIEAHSESIARAHQAGVPIAMGTDAGVMPHGTNLRELGLMCNIGMSPMEVVVATTKIAAQCLGWHDRLGTLEPGKLADVIVTATDPLADIRSLEQPDNVVLVIQDGKVVKNLRA